MKICILRDISLRKELERKITIRTEITLLLLEGGSLDQAFPLLISKISSQFGWELGRFWLSNPQTMGVDLVYTSLAECAPILAEFVSRYQQIALLSIDSEVPLQGIHQPYFANQLLANPLDTEEGRHEDGFSSYLLVPVALKKRIYGYIEMFSRKPMEKDELLMGIFSDIGIEVAMFIERQEAVKREQELQKQLIEVARESGKSQLATHVLHNVGNALNTLNTSISIVNENFKNSELDNLSKVADLLKQHSHDLPSFLAEDPKGKHLPEYVIALSKWWIEEKAKSTREFEKISQNLEHIKKVISSQQRFSTIAGIKSEISINDLLDDVINLKARDSSDNSITICRQYEKLPLIETDKAKFLQILYNLFCNAIDAVNEKSQGSKTITLKTDVFEGNKIRVHMIDNGCGIDPANAVKIFSYGFTTKKDGHGFGLHSSAILAEELGGTLQLNSPGLGKGAEFTITVPFN